MTRQTRKTPAERPPQQPPKPSAKPSSGSQLWLGWAAVILVAIVVLIGIAIGAERLNDGAEPAGAEVQITPIVGGMAVPTASPGGSSGEPDVTATHSGAVTPTETLSATGAAGVNAGETPSRTQEAAGASGAEDNPVPDTLGTVFEPGATVQNAAGNVVIYAEPSLEAQILDTYAPGIALTVLEPGGDFRGYPVEIDGAGWVRVRAEDGLAGWTPAAALSRTN